MFKLFPCDLRIGQVIVRVRDASVARGPAALLNAVGYYDPNNMRFTQEVLGTRLASTFVDVGANLGIYSLLAATSLDDVRVLAVEPHPQTCKLLKENVELNGKQGSITCCQVALGDFNGRVLLTDQSVSALNYVLAAPAPEAKGIEVVARRGDDLCAEHGFVPEMLKIDVEGYEMHVLEGFGSALRSCKMLLVESKSVLKTAEAIRRHADFLGPYKIDYRRHRFAGTEIHGEDWLFVNLKAQDLLRDWIQAG